MKSSISLGYNAVKSLKKSTEVSEENIASIFRVEAMQETAMKNSESEAVTGSYIL
jgi:hypothetical protein